MSEIPAPPPYDPDLSLITELEKGLPSPTRPDPGITERDPKRRLHWWERIFRESPP